MTSIENRPLSPPATTTTTTTNDHQHDDNQKLYLNLGEYSTNSSVSYLHKQPRGYVKAPTIESMMNASAEAESSPSSPEYASFSANIVRKKSGERVKSSLKLPGLVPRTRSLPNTKNVHFDSQDYVRPFWMSDQPTVISSAESTPTKEKRAVEFHVGGDKDRENNDESTSSSDDEDEDIFSKKTEWNINLTNFSNNSSVSEDDGTVFLESVSLSANKENIIGHILVKNLAFHKTVTVRYTLDYWKTVSEIIAVYDEDIRKKYKNMNFDKFTFKLNLQDLPQHSLHLKSMFFCIRYNTNGKEFWDNNNRYNYQVDFNRVVSAATSQRRISRRQMKEHNNNHHLRSRSEPALDDHRDFVIEAISPDLNAIDGVGKKNLRATNSITNSTNNGSSPTKSKVKQLTSRYNFGASFRNHHKHNNNDHHNTMDNNDEESFTFPHSSISKPTLTTNHLFSRPAWDSTSYQDLLNNYCFFKEKKDLKHNTNNNNNDRDDNNIKNYDDDDIISPTTNISTNPQKSLFKNTQPQQEEANASFTTTKTTNSINDLRQIYV